MDPGRQILDLTAVEPSDLVSWEGAVSGILVWAEHAWHWRSGKLGAAEVTSREESPLIGTFCGSLEEGWALGVERLGDVTSATGMQEARLHLPSCHAQRHLETSGNRWSPAGNLRGSTI